MTRSLDQALLQGADVSAMAAANLLVNGFHTVSQQYGTTATAISLGGGYGTDQWVIQGSGTWAGTFQQVSSPFPSQPDVPNGLKVSITTAQATLASGDFVEVYQPLEGMNLARLVYGGSNAKTVTLVFLIRPTIFLNGYVSLVNAGGTLRSYTSRYTAAANTDTFVYLTIPGDVAQALTLTNATSMQVRWNFGTGATYQGAANSWSGSNVRASSDVTNLAATVGNNVILSGAVMLPGVVPITQAMLPMLARPFDDELRKCQRYYQTGGGVLVSAYAGGTFGGFSVSDKLIPMRAQPSFSAANNGGSYTGTLILGGGTQNIQVWFGSASTAIGQYCNFTYVANARM